MTTNTTKKLTAESAKHLAARVNRIDDAKREFEEALEEFADAESELIMAKDSVATFGNGDGYWDLELTQGRFDEAESKLGEARESLERAIEERDDYLANWATYEDEAADVEETLEAIHAMIDAAKETGATSCPTPCFDFSLKREVFGALEREGYRVNMQQIEWDEDPKGRRSEPPLSWVADHARQLYLDAMGVCRNARKRYDSGELTIDRFLGVTDAAHAQMEVLAELLGYMGRTIPE